MGARKLAVVKLKEEEANVSSSEVMDQIESIYLDKFSSSKNSSMLLLDFKKYPDLLDVLKPLADRQFRTVEQQIFFILHEFCSEFIYDRNG